MEINEANIQLLASQLRETLHPDFNKRKSAENFLQSFEGNAGYSLLLLALVAKADADMVIRLSAAIAFKNLVKKHWKDEYNESILQESDRLLIKDQIVNLMTNMPESIQKQLGDTISIIGKEDFPDKWPNLLNNMVDKFRTGDFKMINGVLQTAQSIFQRYRHEFKSDVLWTEIKFVLKNFAFPLTELFKATMALLQQYSTDVNALNVIIHSLTLISEIFYSLNYQDLPEFFEDNIVVWMDNFLTLLTLENKSLTNNSEETPGILDVLKSKICEIATLYAQKYDEEFDKYVPPYFKAIWTILTPLPNQPKYDLLVVSGFEYLSVVIRKCENLQTWFDLDQNNANVSLAGNDQAWKNNFCQTICSSLIVPNLWLRTSDSENFEDNPFEYIRFDLESSDVGTRRKAASDLIKSLKTRFTPVPLPINQITLPAHQDDMFRTFVAYGQTLLARYYVDRSKEWKCKDLALYLFNCISPPPPLLNQGALDDQKISREDVIKFLGTEILPEIAEGINTKDEGLIIVKADCIKFLILYRNALACDQVILTNCARHIVQHFLLHPSIVIHSYSAIFLERLLLSNQKITFNNSRTLLNPESIKDLIPQIIENIFASMSYKNSTENEYLMKALMRCVSTLKAHIGPLVSAIVAKLTEILARISKNPSKPYFNHYLFETLCIAIQASPTAIPNYQQGLFIVFQDILKNEVQEFVPYVFQELAALIENSPDSSHPAVNQTPSIDYVHDLLPSILVPSLWDKQGNIPALVRLLQAFLFKYRSRIGEDPSKISAILGVFQKLLSSKVNDHHGLKLIQYVFQYISREKINPYTKQIFFLLFQRLQMAKTPKYLKGLILFFCFYVNEFGPSQLFGVVEEIQPNMFKMTLEKIIAPNLNSLNKYEEKRICSLALIKILTDCPEFKMQQHPELWCTLLEMLVKLLEDQEDITSSVSKLDEPLTEQGIGGGEYSSGDNLLDPPLDEEYRASFSRLFSLPESLVGDNTPNLTVGGSATNLKKGETKAFLANQLNNMAKQIPMGQMNDVMSKMEPKTKLILIEYMKNCNLTL